MPKDLATPQRHPQLRPGANSKSPKPEPNTESTAALPEAWEPEPRAPPLGLGGAGPAGKVTSADAPGVQSPAHIPEKRTHRGAHSPGSRGG